MATTDIAYEGDIDEIVIGEEADSGGYTLLPPGIYPFTIDEPISRERYPGSERIPPCWKAVVKLNVDGGQLGTAKINHNLYVTVNHSWKIKQLFIGVGLITPDAKNWTPPWSSLVGTTGAVELDNHEYNDKTYNNVKAILPPEEASEVIAATMVAQRQAPAPAPAQPAPTVSQPMTMPTFTPVDAPAPAPAPAPAQPSFGFPEV